MHNAARGHPLSEQFEFAKDEKDAGSLSMQPGGDTSCGFDLAFKPDEDAVEVRASAAISRLVFPVCKAAGFHPSRVNAGIEVPMVLFPGNGTRRQVNARFDFAC